MDKEEINLRINRIIGDCDSSEGLAKLREIQLTLNNENSLQVTSGFERIKHFFRKLNPQYRKDSERAKLETATQDIMEVIRKHIVSAEEIIQHKVLKQYPSEFGYVVNEVLDLECGLEVRGNSIKRYPIELTDSIKQGEYSKLLDRNCI